MLFLAPLLIASKRENEKGLATPVVVFNFGQCARVVGISL